MVMVERARRQLEQACERVQFVEVRVADQVCPEPAVRGPDRVIDENGHVAILGRNAPPRAALCDQARHPVKLSFGARALSSLTVDEDQPCIRTRRPATNASNSLPVRFPSVELPNETGMKWFTQ